MKRLTFHKLSYYFKSKLTYNQKTLFGIHMIENDKSPYITEE